MHGIKSAQPYNVSIDFSTPVTPVVKITGTNISHGVPGYHDSRVSTLKTLINCNCGDRTTLATFKTRSQIYCGVT